jgi:hypothetical protein
VNIWKQPQTNSTLMNSSNVLDPVARAVATAPPDDEPVTDEDRRRFREGQAWFRQRGGKGIPMSDLLAEFDLKPERSSAPAG